MNPPDEEPNGNVDSSVTICWLNCSGVCSCSALGLKCAAWLGTSGVLRGASNIPALGDSTKFLKSKSALKAYAAATYDYVLTALREATPAQLLKESKLFGFPLAPAWRWLELSHEHSAWTLGQTIPYLRLNRVNPPAYNMPF